MSAPRIETLLVSLIVLVAAGVALAAAYAPSIPRQPQAGVVQESSHETEKALIAPPAQPRSDDRQTASNASQSVIDVAAQWIDWMDVDGRIALPVISGIVSLMLVIVVVMRRQHTVTARRSTPARHWGATIQQWWTTARRRALPWTGAVHHVAMFSGAFQGVAQRWRNVLPQGMKTFKERARALRSSFIKGVWTLEWALSRFSRSVQEKGSYGESFFRRVSESPGSFQQRDAPHPSSLLVEKENNFAGADCSGTPLSPSRIACFGHWDKQTPPGGEGGMGDEGKKVSECDKHTLCLKHSTFAREGKGSKGNRVSECGEQAGDSTCDDAAHRNRTTPGTSPQQTGDQAERNHRLIASFQQADSQPEPDAADAHQSITTDSAAAAVAAVLDVYERHGLAHSVVTFAEASVERQRAQVRLTVAAHPNESSALAELPEQMRMIAPGSKAQWQRTAHAQPVLNVALRGALPVMRSGRLLLPVAHHQEVARLPSIHRSAPVVSFLPLRTWRHIGFYGGKAVESASSALIDLLYIEAPDALAVTIIDEGQISALCTGTPHLVPTPGKAANSLMALGRAARSFQQSGAAVRPLLIVLVEPDAAMLRVYGDLVARLLRRPDAPVYTLLVQTRQSDASRLLNLPLPAVITGGTGRSTGEVDQPLPGTARIIAPHMRIERQCYMYDAARLAALTVVLRDCAAASLPPTAWDATDAS
jgi:hypothetical protein